METTTITTNNREDIFSEFYEELGESLTSSLKYDIIARKVSKFQLFFYKVQNNVEFSDTETIRGITSLVKGILNYISFRCQESEDSMSLFSLGLEVGRYLQWTELVIWDNIPVNKSYFFY